MSDEITQQTLLPEVKDPNLWMVKCRIGEEKITVLHLMRKMVAYQFEPEPLLIRSVVAPEHVKGYIYIEAFKQSHVKAAIGMQIVDLLLQYMYIVYQVFSFLIKQDRAH